MKTYGCGGSAAANISCFVFHVVLPEWHSREAVGLLCNGYVVGLDTCCIAGDLRTSYFGVITTLLLCFALHITKEFATLSYSILGEGLVLARGD